MLDRETFVRAASCASLTDLEAELRRFARRFGFRTYALLLITDQATGLRATGINNMPPKYMNEFTNLDLGAKDPVMQHCKTSSLPMLWDQSIYVKNNQGERWERMAFHGLRSGSVTAMHLPKGKHIVLGMEWDDRAPCKESDRYQVLSSLQFLTAHIVDPASELLVDKYSTSNNSTGNEPLSAKEREILLWTAEGKTAGEIAQILSISESYANKLMGQALRKLDCVNKHQAVARAMRLGILADLLPSTHLH